MQQILEHYKDLVVQIATPYSTGTGFYISAYNLIVTNEHVVRDNLQVVIEGKLFERQLSDVVYLDKKYDVAFLAPPVDITLPTLELGDLGLSKEGSSVYAIGHPFGLKFTATHGIISSTQQITNDIPFIQHDAALNPGNSGGPLIDENGHVIGVNTFIIRNGNNIGFSLPVHLLKQSLEQYTKQDSTFAARCNSCSNVVFEHEVKNDKYCPHCGQRVLLPNKVEAYEALGVNRSIEQIIESLNHNVALARIGPNHWQVIEGSAKITISYHEKTGLIIGDAHLARLPKTGIKEIYTYLLEENYRVKGLSFAIRDTDIILSLIIYDRYLNMETGKVLFERLFQQADHYDNILVEDYGAKWHENR